MTICPTPTLHLGRIKLSGSMLELVRRGRHLRFIVVTGHQDWRCRLAHRVIKMN